MTNKHLQYLSYVVRHKRFVYREGRKLGVGRLQLLIHDWQKFTPAEWNPYVETFYGNNSDAYKDAFDLAWLHHQKLGGKHHWQYWVMPEDTTGVKILNIPNIYMREMVCDWIGAGKAQGKFSPNHDKYLETRNWYDANKDKLQLSLITRRRIEYFIGYY